jgi:hypothetical protein
MPIWPRGGSLFGNPFGRSFFDAIFATSFQDAGQFATPANVDRRRFE